jgi:hypothetical protein
VSETLYVGAPQGTSWPLDLARAEAPLRERFPDAFIRRGEGRASGRDYLSFDVTVNGERRHGVYAEGLNLALSDGSPADWAETIVWFLSLLPEGTAAVAMTEDNFQLTPIPPSPSVQSIRDLFDAMIAGA